MMPMGWGFSPWPMLAVAAMVAFAVFLAVRMVHGHGFGQGAMGCGSVPPSPPLRHPDVEAPTAPPAPEDPMSTLRRRLVDGEIDLGEFEARLDALLRSDPSLSMPWWDQPIDAPKGAR